MVYNATSPLQYYAADVQIVSQFAHPKFYTCVCVVWMARIRGAYINYGEQQVFSNRRVGKATP